MIAVQSRFPAPLVVALGAMALAARVPSAGALLVVAAVGVVGALAPVSHEHAGPTPAVGRWAVAAAGLAGVCLVRALGPGPVVRAGLVAVGASLVAAVAEELFFRRLVYGWLAGWGAAVAVVGSATLFALVHVPVYGVAVLPIDLAAGLLLSWQRWASGGWTIPAATHAAANLLAWW